MMINSLRLDRKWLICVICIPSTIVVLGIEFFDYDLPDLDLCQMIIDITCNSFSLNNCSIRNSLDNYLTRNWIHDLDFNTNCRLWLTHLTYITG